MPTAQEFADRLARTYAGPMSEKEVAIVEDMKAFLQFCLENGMSSLAVFGTLAHDVDGLLRQERSFVPKVTGYSRILADLHAESNSPIEVEPDETKDEKWD